MLIHDTNLQKDLVIKDVKKDDGSFVELAMNHLRGDFITKNVYIEIEFLKVRVTIELYIKSVDTTIRLDTFWPESENIDKCLYRLIEDLYYTLCLIKNVFGKTLRKLHIKLFLTNLRKKYPIGLIKSNSAIEPEYVNSGYSYMRLSHDNDNDNTNALDNVDIVIYRKEEVLKVLKHEILHVIGVHESYYSIEYDEKLKERYNIESRQRSGKLNLFEAYVEFFALLLNTFIYTYLTRRYNDKGREKEFLREFDIHIGNEIGKSTKIVERMFKECGIRRRNGQWSFETRLIENTNVFSYYIIKWCLLKDWKKTLKIFEGISDKYMINNSDNFNKYFEYVDYKLKVIDFKKLNLEYKKYPYNMDMRMSLYNML